ncbi:helix-turn-helix domain-containing protein [Streptomyces sp. NBC_00555]|uniref:helix-turn-helix domain-containing protein n=1 Tax=Streptomyces sp. NBC_00555 TaxID=2903662 RepID=UPI00225B3A8E|nr:helix-turn-helix domain-containing protein [Streptomyces sp. NBC_00555]MCX5012203.1 helix-turn-helix domain-containing protein [Streptomyces sp. NBC_00555]
MTQSVETTSELSLPSPEERRRLREAADLTHEEVAAAVGVTPATVRSWETGRTDPRGRKREAYVQFLAGLGDPSEGVPEAGAEAGAGAGAELEAEAEAEAEGAAEAEPEAGAEAEAAGPAPEAVEDAVEQAVEEVPPLAAATEAGGADGADEPPVLPEPAPDDAPVAAATGGAAAAFDALYALAAPALIHQTYLLTGRRALAREAVERAFRQAWRQWPDVDTDPDPVGWVRTAAYDCALSPWHQLRPAHRHTDKPPAEPADRILLDALLSLPTAHRRTVLLYDGVGLDLPDTAAETEATTPTAGSRLLHAHEYLADRVPELADVPPVEQSELLHDMLAALTPAVQLEPRPAALVRGRAEGRTRMWTRAALGMTSVIAVATAYTAATAPTQYQPPIAPGANVSGVPPLSGPQRLTEQSRLLHDKLRADPASGPARLTPGIE